ncbi:hypothetical protein [Alkaliflexus imshenetskii]|nr:hypothetical protein [Alkaliflexus imshenetskii]
MKFFKSSYKDLGNDDFGELIIIKVAEIKFYNIEKYIRKEILVVWL